MSNPLPHHIDPLRSADAGLVLSGEAAFAQMPRLAGIVINRSGAAHIELRFGRDDQGVRGVQGRIVCEVELICQRCLQPLQLPVAIDVSLGIVLSEQEAERLPAHYDPLLVGDEPLLVGDLVEDEILLALPGFPRHDPGVCEAAGADAAPADEEPPPGRPNPFAVLARLKSN